MMITNYLENRKDVTRLNFYKDYGIADETSKVVIERLIGEYNSAVEYNDQQFQRELSSVIDYLLDCYIG